MGEKTSLEPNVTFVHWQRCPVCNGGGWVWGSLYHGLPTTETAACRTCGGNGIVVAPNSYTAGSRSE